MDPDACLKRWAFAVADGDVAEAREAHDDLMTWLGRGGFFPTVWDASPEGIQAREEFFAWNQ